MHLASGSCPGKKPGNFPKGRLYLLLYRHYRPESLRSALGSIFKQLVQDASVEEYARSAAVTALAQLMLAGQMPRTELVEYFRFLLTGELMEEIRQAYADNLIYPGTVGLDEIEEEALKTVDARISRTTKHSGSFPPGPVEKEIAWMSCFRPDRSPQDYESDCLDGFEDREYDGSGTYVRPAPKAGRNDPCPCGSGKKYKNAV